MKKSTLVLLVIVQAISFCGFSMTIPVKMNIQMRKSMPQSDINDVKKLCVIYAKEHNTCPESYLWNIAMESDFDASMFKFEEKTKYLRVGALSFTKTSCIMIGIVEKDDSWEMMKEKAREFSKLSLLDQMPWIKAYYDWQIFYRFKKNLLCKKSEIVMRLLTFHPVSSVQKNNVCICKKIDPCTYLRNITYDLNKDGNITLYEISRKYELKKKIYV